MVMTLYTRRRRVSSETRRKYRAIQGFFRRAIGSTASQPDLQITSSIAINVTDIKQRLAGLEQHIAEVSNTCRELFNVKSKLAHPGLADDEIKSEESKLPHTARELLYSPLESKSTEQSGYQQVSTAATPKITSTGSVMKVNNNKAELHDSSNVFSRQCDSQLDQKSLISSYSTSSFRSLAPRGPSVPCHSGHTKDKYRRHGISNLKIEHSHLKNIDNDFERHTEIGKKHSRKHKRPRDLDEDFITDIIKRQYKPVRMFSHRISHRSQFTPPICRDRDQYTRDSIQDLPFHYYSRSQRSSRKEHHSDIRSVSDVQFHRNKSNHRLKHLKKCEEYNDTNFYDLIPVKEKSSPKSRRKFAQEHTLPHPTYYKEVPPSPISNRPRFNLEAQNVDSDVLGELIRSPRRAPYISTEPGTKQMNVIPTPQENIKTSHILPLNVMDHTVNITKDSLKEKAVSAKSENLSTLSNGLNSIGDHLLSAGKTSQALTEIKDILHHFLQEIKKEAALQSEKSKSSTDIHLVDLNRQSTVNYNSKISNSENSFNNKSPQYPVPPAQYMPGFGNPCCYPVIPMCPLSCVHNSFVVPSPSCTCTAKAKDSCQHKENQNKSREILKNETEQLIKKIYDAVVRSPTFSRKYDDSVTADDTKCPSENNRFTARTTEGSEYWRQGCHDDVPKFNYISKSCEVIGCAMAPESYVIDMNPERLSLEATASTVQFMPKLKHSTRTAKKEKEKKTKIARLLQSFGLFRKKKDVIEELSESEEIDKVETNSPYHHNVMKCTVHGEKYSHISQECNYKNADHNHSRRSQNKPTMQNYRSIYPDIHDYSGHDPRIPCAVSVNNMRRPEMPFTAHARADSRYSGPPPSAPPYSHDMGIPPQVPLCFKEVEVRSTACQSERKLSLFRKLTKVGRKEQTPPQSRSERYQNHCGTQTVKRPSIFQKWSNFEAKAFKNVLQEDPEEFTAKTQKKLAEKQAKIKSKVNNTTNRLLYNKRSPLSAMILRSLIGGGDRPQPGFLPGFFI